MRRSVTLLLPLLLLALLVAGLGMLLLSEAPRPPAPMAWTGSSVEAGVAPAGAEELPEPWETELEGAPDSENGNERVEILSSEPEGSAGAGPVAVVVDGASGAPVAGAAVSFIERDLGRRRHRESGRPWLHDVDLAPAYGPTLRADAQGRVPLPVVRDRLLVSAAHGGAFGVAAPLRGQSGEVRVALWPDETVVVQVVDAAGEPRGGVLVSLFQGNVFGKARTLWTAPTDADGRAAARHFQVFRRGEKDGDRFAAALRVPLAVPVAAEFAGRPAPQSPIVLTLPATGGVEIALTDREGQPLLSEADVVLQAVRQEGFALTEAVAGGFDRLRARKRAEREVAAFGPVGLGMLLRPVVRLRGDEDWWGAPPLRGPTRPGEVVAGSVALPEQFTLLSGRLLDPSGAPLARRWPHYDLSVRGRSLASERTRTAEDGRLQIIARLGQRRPDALELRVRPGAEAPLIGLRVPLSGLRLGARNDLGELVLGVLPPIASGIVVDDRGQPVAEAGIRLQVYQRRGDREGWSDAALARARTDGEGRFALEGTAPEGERLRVRARRQGHFPGHSPEIAPGAEVRIAMTRTGVLDGVALLPAWVPRDALSLRLARQDDAKVGRTAQLRPRGGRARYRLVGLVPGLYDAVFRLRNLRDPLLVVPGVLIQPGDNEDSRLREVDLLASVFRYRVTAVGAAGERLVSLEGPILARVTGLDGRRRNAGFRWRRGRAELITHSPTVELVLFGTGLRPTTATLGPGDHDVYLQRLHPAVVELPGARQLCGFGRKVRVSMVCTEDTGLPTSLRGVDQRSGKSFSFPRWQLAKSGGAWLGDTDRVEVPLSRNGPYQVILRLYEEGVGGNVSRNVGVVDVVLDGPAPMRRTLAVDPQKIADAIAELQRRKAAGAVRRGQRRRGR